MNFFGILYTKGVEKGWTPFLSFLSPNLYICKTQIDVQPLIDVQFSNIWPFFTFSNQRPITSLTYTSNDVTPVRTWF